MDAAPLYMQDKLTTSTMVSMTARQQQHDEWARTCAEDSRDLREMVPRETQHGLRSVAEVVACACAGGGASGLSAHRSGVCSCLPKLTPLGQLEQPAPCLQQLRAHAALQGLI